MEEDWAISFNHVYKNYPLFHQKTLKEFFQALFTRKKTIERIDALKDINLKIKKGETVGVIGKNGAGKSTLLKLIAQVSSPTAGKVRVKGRISPLIELGAGFHPELSGKENIFLNGVILGMKEKYLVEKFSEIVAFSEIPMDFIYTPVKYYSSGMFMRLAFSVAIFSRPEILLVDEILAVGDIGFQKKCLAKMEEFKKKKVTIIFVSHSLELVKKFCQRVIYLQGGRVEYDGKAEEAIGRYLQNLRITLS
ncbi:MAG: ABC transporter ATP-binding protein [Microgenomates group bacterium]|jgi:ABC-type polysaccharide/polyol phosphate transport system ATPase subunit|nr:ABC transporter ATP-binding protein [Microgenomates group bacterium]